MNIFWQELKYYRRSTAIWIVVLCAVMLLFLSVYPSLSTQIDTFREIVSKYPKALLTAINFQFSIFYSVYGLFSYMLTFIWVAGAIMAMNYGVSVIGKETSGRTADFLLSKPVGRVRVLSEKFAATFVLILITNIFFTSLTFLGAKVISNTGFSEKSFLLLSVSLFFIQLFFVTLGFLVGTMSRKIRSVISVTLPTVFGFYTVGALAAIVDKPFAYYLTPFKYFDATYIFQNNHYQYTYLIVLAVFVLVCLAGSYSIYLHKDITD
ncbi:MAG: ABC transporter permease subunit [Candidatus Saccharibacteria bacterium]